MTTLPSAPWASTRSRAAPSTSTRKRERSTGSMVRLSMLSSAAARAGSPPPEPASSPARRRRAWVKARLVAGTRSRARTAPCDVTAPGADPGQAEGGRCDVVRVGAGAHDVERLGDVGVAAGLAGERQRQLGRQLAGHLPVDRVERALRLGRLPARQGDQPRHPHRAPLPRVVAEQRAHGVVDPVELPGLERGPGPGQQHLGAVRRGTLEGGQPLDGVVDAHGAQPRHLRVAVVGAQPGQVLPVERVVGDRGHVEEQGRRGVLGGALAAGGDDLAQHPEQLHAQLVGRDEAVGRVGRAGLEQQPVERVVLAEQRGVGDRRERGHVGALVAAELHGEHGERAPDRVDVGGHRRADVRHLGRLVARRAVDRGVEVVERGAPRRGRSASRRRPPG